MYLYIFEIINKKRQVIKTYNKFCRYPKKTKIYKQLYKSLESGEIYGFNYYVN